MAARYLGSVLVVLGLAFNPFSVGYYTSDGSVDSVAANAAIILVEVVFVVCGAAVIIHKPKGCDNYALCISILLAMIALFELLSLTTDVFLPRDYEERHNLFYGFYQPDSVLGFRPKPNLKDAKMSWLEEDVAGVFSSDEHGFANTGKDYSKGKIYFIGDSFTLGYWVKRDDSFVGRIESALNAPVINLGVGGYGFEQYYELMKSYVQKYRPQSVVLCIFANDLEKIHTPAYYNDYYVNAGWDKYKTITYKSKSALARVIELLVNVRIHDQYEMPNGIVLHRYRGANREYISSLLYLDVERKLQDILSIARQNMIKIYILCIPSKESVYKEQYSKRYGSEYLRNEEYGYSRICKIASENKVRCIDLTSDYRDLATRGVTLYFDKDPHWKSEGHMLAAQVMLKHLAE
jgi:hypothetical protein